MDRRERAGTDPGERGFSLMEVIVATVIATLAVTGLAYTFGMGRGFIDRFEVVRAALGVAQGRMDRLATLSTHAPEFTLGSHAEPFVYQGVAVGNETWVVEAIDDPATPALHGTLRQVTVDVALNAEGIVNSVRLVRLFRNT